VKNEGGREAGNGKCSKDVLDRGDRCQFIFLWSRRIFCNVFPYSVCKAQLIGDWYETKGARNTTSLLIIRQFYWRTDVPCANSTGGRNTKKKIVGSLCLVRIASWRRGTSVRQYIGAQIHPAHWKENNLHVTYAGGVEAYILHVSKRRTEQFGAPRLYIRCRKDDGSIKTLTNIDRHDPVPVPYSNSSLLHDTPPFWLSTTFNFRYRISSENLAKNSAAQLK
jgi:hypothetical protein